MYQRTYILYEMPRPYVMIFEFMRRRERKMCILFSPPWIIKLFEWQILLWIVTEKCYSIKSFLLVKLPSRWMLVIYISFYFRRRNLYNSVSNMADSRCETPFPYVTNHFRHAKNILVWNYNETRVTLTLPKNKAKLFEIVTNIVFSCYERIKFSFVVKCRMRKCLIPNSVVAVCLHSCH